MQEPSLQTIRNATAGSLSSVNSIIGYIQPRIFNLAVRMLGNREDAADATQEILLKVITRLSTFRSDAAFSTWVFRVAKNHLLTALTSTREHPDITFESITEVLENGMTFNDAHYNPYAGRMLEPDEKLEVKQIALACTQKMLMALDRNQRLSYILDLVFGLSSEEASYVLEISSDAHRQRLARGRAKLDSFVSTACGLASAAARCHCEKQIAGVRHCRSQAGSASQSVVAVHHMELDEIQRNFDSLVRMGKASELIKAHPSYQAPESMRTAIRFVLSAEGFLSGAAPRRCTSKVTCT